MKTPLDDKLFAMKKLNFLILLIFTTTISLITSCDDNLANRGTIDLTDYSKTSSDDEDQVEEEEITTLTRPEGAIIIDAATSCACADGKSQSVGNCASVCAEVSTDETSIFYFEFDLTTAITGTYLNDINGFCSTQETDDTSDVANCSIEIKDSDGDTQYISFEPSSGQGSVTIEDFDGYINSGETYRLSIVENVTGAKSTTVQVKLVPNLIDDPIGGQLAIMPVNQYTCMVKTYTSNSSGQAITGVNRFHFYFIAATRPEALQESSMELLYCHDIDKYGDEPVSSPLLEEKTGIFSVWNNNDKRFYDTDDDGVMQVINLIEQDMTLQGYPPTDTLTLFYDLSWPNFFDDGDVGTGSNTTTTLNVVNGNLGKYMTPFIDSETLESYCPKKEHYYSDSPLFTAMREMVADDTEALYVAKQENVCDFILVRESLLKKIWFYIEDNNHIAPKDDNVGDNKIQFYWPADTSSPFIKKSHQVIYTVKRADELTCGSATIDETNGNSSSGSISDLPTHDRRIGCIPVLAD